MLSPPSGGLLEPTRSAGRDSVCRFDEGLPDVAGKYHRSFQMTVIWIFRTYMRLGVLFDDLEGLAPSVDRSHQN